MAEVGENDIPTWFMAVNTAIVGHLAGRLLSIPPIKPVNTSD